MSDSDVLEMLGFLFIAYGIGWSSGYAILTFKKVMDFI